MNKFSPSEMLVELGLMLNSKKLWLDQFSKGKHKRPDWEIDQKTHELRVLEQARAAYQKLSERGKNEVHDKTPATGA
jgi:uncharacterized damage-inducible protein DinB